MASPGIRKPAAAPSVAPLAPVAQSGNEPAQDGVTRPKGPIVRTGADAAVLAGVGILLILAGAALRRGKF